MWEQCSCPDAIDPRSGTIVDDRRFLKDISGTFCERFFSRAIYQNFLHLTIMFLILNMPVPPELTLPEPMLLPGAAAASILILEDVQPLTDDILASLIPRMEKLSIEDVDSSNDSSHITPSSGSSIHSIQSFDTVQTESTCSSVSGSATPVKKSAALSESVTPVEDGSIPRTLDPDQLTLQLHLHAARNGNEEVPQWEGLPRALRTYFGTSWHEDSFTERYCEEHKNFLFWNAVADDKWRNKRG